MKAITVWQPYASLIAKGLKHYETRLFKTEYRGPLLIHSGSRTMRWVLNNSAESALDVAIEAFGMEAILDLPRGSAICIVDLVDCIEMTPELIAEQDPTELAVGDWKPGRYAWKLENPREMEPMKLRGWQGLWDAWLCDGCYYAIDYTSVLDFPYCARCVGCDGVNLYEPADEHRCAICGDHVAPKRGHNLAPVADGICCEKCNIEVVIPARIEAAKNMEDV